MHVLQIKHFKSNMSGIFRNIINRHFINHMDNPIPNMILFGFLGSASGMYAGHEINDEDDSFLTRVTHVSFASLAGSICGVVLGMIGPVVCVATISGLTVASIETIIKK